jgi:UDP-N-acetylglucosamine 2-epimerase
LKKNQRGDFKFGEIDVFETFKADFEYYYRFLLPLMVLYLELSIQLLKREQPDIILMKNEYSEFERALQFAAHFKQIPVIALQHGVIHKTHPGYQYNKSAISQDGSSKFPYAPIPTITTVFGPYFKHILTKESAYPTSRVEVTGQPRYDILHSANRIYDKQKFCDQFGINPNKKIVLIATQPFPVEKTRFEFLYHTTAALREIPDIQIIIKPHPNESVRWHRNHLESWGVSAIILPPQSETFAAIHACDLFVSVTSTTILEALILNMASSFKKALFDERAIRQVQANRSKFVFNHTFKNDGKATDRVVSIIKKYCNADKR